MKRNKPRREIYKKGERLPIELIESFKRSNQALKEAIIISRYSATCTDKL